MAPVRSYTNWNSRTTDEEEQIEPYRKYFFICEGANTETWYFKFEIPCFGISTLTYEEIFTIRLNLFFFICSSAIPIRITSYWSQGYSSSLKSNVENTGIAPYLPSRYALLNTLSYLSLKRSKE